jgi:hypothetical protein
MTARAPRVAAPPAAPGRATGPVSPRPRRAYRRPPGARGGAVLPAMGGAP